MSDSKNKNIVFLFLHREEVQAFPLAAMLKEIGHEIKGEGMYLPAWPYELDSRKVDMDLDDLEELGVYDTPRN